MTKYYTVKDEIDEIRAEKESLERLLEVFESQEKSAVLWLAEAKRSYAYAKKQLLAAKEELNAAKEELKGCGGCKKELRFMLDMEVEKEKRLTESLQTQEAF